MLSIGNKHLVFFIGFLKGLNHLAHYLFCMCYTMGALSAFHDGIMHCFVLLLAFLFVCRGRSTSSSSSFHMHPSLHITSIELKFKRFKCSASTNMFSPIRLLSTYQIKRKKSTSSKTLCEILSLSLSSISPLVSFKISNGYMDACMTHLYHRKIYDEHEHLSKQLYVQLTKYLWNLFFLDFKDFVQGFVPAYTAGVVCV